MTKYRILTNGFKYRVQSKDWLLWRYIRSVNRDYTEYIAEWDSLVNARMWVKEKLVADKTNNKNWHVAEDDEVKRGDSKMNELETAIFNAHVNKLDWALGRIKDLEDAILKFITNWEEDQGNNLPCYKLFKSLMGQEVDEQP